MDPAFVFTPAYDFVLPGPEEGEQPSNLHHFDGHRASRAWAALIGADARAESGLLTPRRVTEDELRLVHDEAYLASLNSPETIAEISEIPRISELSPEVLEEVLLRPQRFGVGGTLLAVRQVMKRGIVVNLSGGYHHAKRDRGGGFCVFSDLAIGAVVARQELGIERIAMVDLDVHQGNGTASIFSGDEDVAQFDIYNADIFPDDEPAQAALRWNHPVHSGCDSATYLALLERELPRALDEFEPQLVLYNAGTDIIAGDPLGLLELDAPAVSRRDSFVLEETNRRQIPTVVTASGGYSDRSHELLAELLGGVWRRSTQTGPSLG